MATANAQGLLRSRLNLDGAVVTIRRERRRLVRHHILAAQVFLDSGEGIPQVGDRGQCV